MSILKKIMVPAVVMVVLIGAAFPMCACSQPQQSGMPVVLLTDFGTDSYWVPELKGIVYSSNPHAVIIDELNTLKLSINMGSFSKSYDTRAGSKIEVKKSIE